MTPAVWPDSRSSNCEMLNRVGDGAVVSVTLGEDGSVGATHSVEKPLGRFSASTTAELTPGVRSIRNICELVAVAPTTLRIPRRYKPGAAPFVAATTQPSTFAVLPEPSLNAVK